MLPDYLTVKIAIQGWSAEVFGPRDVVYKIHFGDGTWAYWDHDKHKPNDLIVKLVEAAREAAYGPIVAAS